MSEMLSATPVLPVSNAAEATAFYVEKLGFRQVHVGDIYAIVARDRVEIHLWAATDADWKQRDGTQPIITGAETFLAGTASCRVRATDVDALFAELEPAGVIHPNGGLNDKDYGLREFSVLDQDGNLITFCQPIGNR